MTFLIRKKLINFFVGSWNALKAPSMNLPWIFFEPSMNERKDELQMVTFKKIVGLIGRGRSLS